MTASEPQAEAKPHHLFDLDMISKVLEFPKGDGNDWPSVRESLLVTIEGMHEDATDGFKKYVLDRMAVVYKEMPFPNDVELLVYPEDQQVVTDFLNDFQVHVSKLMISRLIVEMELAIALDIR
jgi:hypothetical protein